MADSPGRNWLESIAGAARIAGALVTPMLRARRARWGATDAELARAYPGDEWVPHPQWGWTHAVTIHAPAAEVWPWVVQIGQGRGGFYSYEGLENLVGCNIHNADRILPEFQDLAVGDGIRLHPQTPPLPVALVEPGRALVVHALSDTSSGRPFELTEGMPAAYSNMLWTFFLDEQDDGTTRLISRTRYDYSPSFANKLMYGPALLEPISHVMDCKMLLGIKERVEAAPGGVSIRAGWTGWRSRDLSAGTDVEGSTSQ